ncbi:class I adenylate-forming enzyme family protein [Nocardiopsis changdeensis]|uniref:Long-chain fatty acid--CoA ligase n=1 Tax=Nocardiopsis changdeensis TaxID=2831969 RepID=A0ABX8BEK6_9ACTN|nr:MULTISPECIES: fatty acid--CoA ligase family protein [Nocardiopsis]QUX20484.1 long-chain fatty acid--CoA ligase [Nocardiopsis changdeensis]QYX36415.1 fatty acid--CoA ligase family protein [Nocardiopsis sp. MT53]
MTWTSAAGLVLTDLVPAQLRERWVREGLCPGRDLYSLFLDRVREDPSREAVVDGHGTLDRAGLAARVGRAAALLRARGCGERDVIGVLLPDGRDALAVELAAAALGAVSLPVPHGRSAADVACLLARSRAALVVTDRDDTGDAPVLRPDPGALDGGGPPPAAAAPDPESPARILVSSGSEGEPSMVAYSHNAMAGGRGAYARAVLGGGPVRPLIAVPLASSFGSLGLVSLVALGATLVLPGPFDPVRVLRAIERHRPTHLVGVPTMLRRAALAEQDADTSSLRALVASGAPLHREVRDLCVRRFGRPVVNVYGSTDGVNCHTAHDPAAWEPGVAGRPDPAVCEIRVCDPRGGPLPAGGTGEILARGPMTPLCHVAAPDLDARRRAPGGWVRTGDLGRIDADGTLRVVDRLRRTVIRGGVTLHPAEVERALAAHPALAEAQCVPVPDPDLGERVCACVCPLPGVDPPTPRELLSHLREGHGVDVRALPEHVVFLPALPLGPTGKVCTATLTRMAAEAVRDRPTVLSGGPR